jgi:hypothetical protein
MGGKEESSVFGIKHATSFIRALPNIFYIDWRNQSIEVLLSKLAFYSGTFC